MDQSTQGLRVVDDFNEKSAGNSTLDAIKNAVADKLHTAADIIEKKGEQNKQSAVAGYASQASALLDDAAVYIRDVDPRKVKADLQRQIRSNPGRSLMVAAGAGLVLGILLKRR